MDNQIPKVLGKANLPLGRYWYTRPSWQNKQEVTVEMAVGDEVVIVFDREENAYPVPLKDIPNDAMFAVRVPTTVTYRNIYAEYQQYHGQQAKVVRELIPDEVGNPEAGRMWRIEFPGGQQINVFPEEIFPDEVLSQLAAEMVETEPEPDALFSKQVEGLTVEVIAEGDHDFAFRVVVPMEMVKGLTSSELAARHVNAQKVGQELIAAFAEGARQPWYINLRAGTDSLATPVEAGLLLDLGPFYYVERDGDENIITEQGKLTYFPSPLGKDLGGIYYGHYFYPLERVLVTHQYHRDLVAGFDPLEAEPPTIRYKIWGYVEEIMTYPDGDETYIEQSGNRFLGEYTRLDEALNWLETTHEQARAALEQLEAHRAEAIQD
ncbi:MAG: hypothetical protein KJ077_10745 [Anaerolineae bacterium]|nr:hypothetical protein [Anaerolineae bacterium]